MGHNDKKKHLTPVQAVARIAAEHLSVEQLASRGMDDLDFHSLHVKSIEDALHAAYMAGREAAQQEA